jgi:hypothetical protein
MTRIMTLLIYNYFTDKRPECIEPKFRTFYSVKTQKWLVIITNVVRTLVLTTKREG